MEEKRISEGIGINMPQECMGISIEGCKVIMKEKGIEIKEINKEVNLPKECISMGVSDIKDCGMIAGRVNEERIKNGEKMIVDDNGKVDYINPEQIEKIADDSNKASQDIKPDLEKTEEIRQEITNLENNMNQINERNPTGESVSQPGDKGNDMVEGNNEVKNEISSGSEGSSGDNSASPGGSSGGDSNNVVVSSGGSGGESSPSSGVSGGDSAPLTGEVIHPENKNLFLSKFVKLIFGV